MNWTKKLKNILGIIGQLSQPRNTIRALVDRFYRYDPQAIIEALSPHLNREFDLDNMPFDLPVADVLKFENLSGLFSSTQLNHAVISLTIRQAAYLFGLIRQMKARKIIEIGRYKGGSTLLMAAAMEGKGELWSIDIGEKEKRVFDNRLKRSFDHQLSDLCERFGLTVNMMVGDSQTLEVSTGEVDLVLVDGDHSYEGAKSDFERFGKRVRLGGALLFDDAFDEDRFKTHSDTIGRVVREIIETRDFKLVKTVNRMAHLERVANGFSKEKRVLGQHNFGV